MGALLRKKDLYEKVGAPKSTIADWITEFAVYIPTVKQGSATYYKPESIDVLIYIKELREKNYSKPQIMTLLAEKGFPITIEEAIEDVQRVLNTENYRDTLLTMMATVGQAVTEIAEQNKALQNIQQQQDEQNGRLTELERKTLEVEVLKKQIEEMKAEIAAVKEKQGSSFLKRLFGR